ncbi:MAG TPA: hypothetical protein VGD98_21020 [Ktedonobacteraceae bacterium]
MPKRRNPFEVRRRRRLPALALVSIFVSLAVILAAGTLIVLWPRLSTHAADADQQPNMDCTLIVPAHPLTAQGLATPYQLVATNRDNGACNEANPVQAAFVQGSIFNFDTGEISVYNPLVIDQGTKPAINPVVPRVPRNAVVALWFGFNGANLTLQSSHNSLQDGRCVNGIKNSIFGQYAYCNAPLFFGEVNQAINLGILTPPALGTAKDGQPCPSVRDFGLVDQDQSDNVTGAYLVTKDGRTAQATTANKHHLANAQLQTNGSDNGLLDAFVDPALGCTPWMAPDLADPGKMATALPLNELQAMADQQAPVALVPLNDPMVLNNNNPDLNKTDLYRAGVDQPRALNNDQASGKTYCQNLSKLGSARIVLDAPMTVKATTPDPATGNTLFTFLAQRFVNSYMNLNCQQLTGQASPLATAQNGNGVAISATINGKPIDTGMGGTGGNGPDCNINGQKVKGCTGMVTVNGQNCTVSFANNTVTMACHKKN